MAKCPSCGLENVKLAKEWDYSFFHVSKFDCTDCKAQFREYMIEGKHAFTLIRKEDGRYHKVQQEQGRKH
ncbi:MAG TPA: hypothetical protein VK536_01780 [Candidatus Limnocylindrales bacterium]|nr:hypothetical protein [Candidatus Limnocylindrales bacterium]